MEEYIKLFQNHTLYETYANSEDYIRPNVSYCEGNNEVHYNYYPPIVAKFNVTNTSNPTTICSNKNKIEEIEIDGVVQPEVVTSYLFDTTGEHTVKYTLVDKTKLDFGLFFYCGNLTSVIIPNSITIISNQTFEYCRNLTSVTIPNSVTSISNSAFNQCSGLTSITIPDSVTNIGERAFGSCSGLTSVTIGNGVTNIGNYAFQSCTGLTNIIIPDSVITIGLYSFNNCNSLTSVIIGSGVTSIDARSFHSSDNRQLNLASIVVDPNNTTYDSRNNCNAIIETATNKLIQGSNNTVIPNSVTSIGSYAFYACYKLSNITIPNSVTTIDDYAFGNCTDLSNINLPNSITRIGSYTFGSCGFESITIPNSVTLISYQAFAMCNKLTSIVIGSGVTNIGSWAFRYCRALNDITSLATTAPNIESDTFDVAYRGTLTIPINSNYNTWMTALGSNWTKVEQ